MVLGTFFTRRILAFRPVLLSQCTHRETTYSVFKVGSLKQKEQNLRVPDDDDGFSTGILYGVRTFGGHEGLTVGLGWGFVDDEIEKLCWPPNSYKKQPVNLRTVEEA